jgi:hypothetical protein
MPIVTTEDKDIILTNISRIRNRYLKKIYLEWFILGAAEDSVHSVAFQQSKYPLSPAIYTIQMSYV